MARRFGRPLLLLTGAPAALLAGLWTVGTVGGNFREVAPGQLYRSAQLSGDTLRRALADHRIASVLNLRGARVGREDYDSEVEICRQLGVVHADIGMSAYRLPKPEELRAVFAALDSLPKPLLVHCQGGSDRSGLVATLYEALYEKMPLDRAQADELTWRYGHLAFTSSGQLDRFFDLYRRANGGHDLRRWIAEDYPAIYRAATHAL